MGRGAWQFLWNATRARRENLGRRSRYSLRYRLSGARQVQAKCPKASVTIFILPPSMKELRTRLERRAEDLPPVIEKRLEAARSEISRWNDYDYVVINDDLQKAFAGLRAIIAAERCRTARAREGIEAFVRKLLAEP